MSESANEQFQRFCLDNPLQMKVFYWAILPVTCILGIIFGVWAIFKLINSNRDKCRRCFQCMSCWCDCCRCCSNRECLWRRETVMYWLALILVINNCLYFLLTSVTALSKCRAGLEELAESLTQFSSMFYFLDWLLVILLFYLRLVFVFDEKSFLLEIVPSLVVCRCLKDKECTLSLNWKKLFWVGAALFVVVCVGVLLAVSDWNPAVIYPLLMCFILLVLANVLLLMDTYLWKMSRLYQRATSGDNRADPVLQKEVLKSSMLATLSLSLTLLSFLLLPASLSGSSQNMTMVEEFVRRLDKLTNVVCVVFLFSAFGGVYDRRLKWCHDKWGRCITHCAKHGARYCCEPYEEQASDSVASLSTISTVTVDPSAETKSTDISGVTLTTKPNTMRVGSTSTGTTLEAENGGSVELKIAVAPTWSHLEISNK